MFVAMMLRAGFMIRIQVEDVHVAPLKFYLYLPNILQLHVWRIQVQRTDQGSIPQQH
jgi:hypothetical protein